MAFILSLETATSVCSIALHHNGILLGALEYQKPQSTAAKLSVMIDQLFKLSELKPSDLSAIAVSAGPGSYTGLRIGVATAKGLCYALNIPLISVNTLELMTRQVQQFIDPTEENLFCPMLDARRMEVYTMLANSGGDVIEATEAKIVDDLSYQSWLNKFKIVFFGNGSEKCKSIIRHKNARFIEGIIPSATQLGEMAFVKLINSQLEDLSSYEPYYLKDFMVKKPKSIV